MTQPITALAKAYRRQTCYVVGKGPSLLHLAARHFGPGPVITLNQAIRTVERLALGNPILSMQKDGAYPTICDSPCADCSQTPPGDMVRPAPGATLLLSRTTSRHCFADYEPRYLFDEAALGLPFYAPSAVVAIRLAELFGCDGLVFVCLDAAVTGDTRVVADGVSTVVPNNDSPGNPENHGYLTGAAWMRKLLEGSRISQIEWVTPGVTVEVV